MYTNALWGRTVSAIPTKELNVDPHITGENASAAVTSFDAASRTLIRKGILPRTDLRFMRKVTLRDKEIEVELTLEADKDTKLLSLFETIPLYAENRTLSANGKTIPFPEAKVTPSHKSLKEMEGSRPDDRALRLPSRGIQGRNPFHHALYPPHRLNKTFSRSRLFFRTALSGVSYTSAK